MPNLENHSLKLQVMGTKQKLTRAQDSEFILLTNTNKKMQRESGFRLHWIQMSSVIH